MGRAIEVLDRSLILGLLCYCAMWTWFDQRFSGRGRSTISVRAHG